MSIRKSVRIISAAVCALIGFSALAPQRASAGTIFAVDDQDNLFTIDSSAPQNVESAGFVSLPGAGEHLINIDVRPSNGLLYGLSSAGKLYQLTVTPSSVTATAVGAGSFGPVSGNSFGADFDPVNDNIRFVSDTDINQTISPTTGLLTSSGPALHYSTAQNPSIVNIAYNNNTNPAPANTTLYGIDSVSDSLVTINPATGLVTTVGPLGVDTDNFVGLDITQNNVALAAMQLPNSSVSDLYSINLSTGDARTLAE